MADFNNNSRSSRDDHSSTQGLQAVLRALGVLAVMQCASGSGPAQAQDCSDCVNGTVVNDTFDGFAGEQFVNTAKRNFGTYEMATR